MLNRVKLLTASVIIFSVAWLCYSTQGFLPIQQTGDFDQYSLIAYNLSVYGKYSDSRVLGEEINRGEVEPYYRRAPGYPLFLVSLMAFEDDLENLGIHCIVKRKPDLKGNCLQARALWERMAKAATLLTASITVICFLCIFRLTNSWLLALSAVVISLGVMPWDMHSRIAGLFLLVHAVFMFLLWRESKIRYGVISGLALGLLILMKSSFQYWLLLLIILAVAPGIYCGMRKLDLVRSKQFALVALFAALVAAPWMARNYLVVGEFTMSGRGGEVLGIRAEYDTMTSSELLGAFIYYLPNARPESSLRDWLMENYSPRTFGYTRFDRNFPGGFYRRSKLSTGQIAGRAEEIDKDYMRNQRSRDAILTEAAKQTIKENLVTHALLSVAFALRGVNYLSPEFNRGDRYSRAKKRMSQTVRSWFNNYLDICRWISYCFVPLALWLFYYGIRRRSYAYALLAGPVLYGFFFHAGVTHFIERYNQQFSLLFLVVFFVALDILFGKGPRRLQKPTEKVR